MKDGITMVRERLRQASLAVVTSLYLVVASIAPTVAIACEGGGADTISENLEGTKGTCINMVLKDKCQVTFTAGANEKEIEKATPEGPEALKRYSFTSECEMKKKIKPGESCVDLVEVIKEVKPSENEYCLYLKDEVTHEKAIRACVPLKM
jgi:hypothetical protein